MAGTSVGCLAAPTVCFCFKLESSWVEGGREGTAEVIATGTGAAGAVVCTGVAAEETGCAITASSFFGGRTGLYLRV